MTPTLSDYLHGLRRLWWVPVATLLLGVGLAGFSTSGAKPVAVTSSQVLFTFRAEDPGQDSAGAARGAESVVANSRLQAYLLVARSAQQVRERLADHGIEDPPTTLSPAGGFKNGAAHVLIDSSGSGVVEVRVKNGELTQAEATQLVEGLSRDVVRIAVATDSQQATPSLRPDPIVATPQVVEDTPSQKVKLALPVLLLLGVGLGLVYFIVWRQDRINTRKDVEDRMGARVLGEVSGRPSDGAALALALTKGRAGTTRALLVPVDPSSDASTRVSELIAEAGPELGLTVTVAHAAEAARAPVLAPPAGAADAGATPGLELVTATEGLDAATLRAAASVDIVGLIVQLGTSSYRDLNAAGRTLAELTDAEIAVIGVLRPTRRS